MLTQRRPFEGIRRRQPSISQGERHPKKWALLALQSQTSSLQNGEEINYCCLSHLVCSALLWQPSKFGLFSLFLFISFPFFFVYISVSNVPFLWGHQSYSTKVCPNDLTLTWLPGNKSDLWIRSHSEVLGIRTSHMYLAITLQPITVATSGSGTC